jgi:hypothetical protein
MESLLARHRLAKHDETLPWPPCLAGLAQGDSSLLASIIKAIQDSMLELQQYERQQLKGETSTSERQLVRSGHFRPYKPST